MKMARHFVLYATLIVVFGGLIFYLLHAGKSFDHPISPFAESAKSKPDSGGFFSGLYKVNLQEALPRLLLQIIIIIVLTQLLGWLFKKIGQPAVIGETVAGIILGPSLLGLLFPGIFHFIFLFAYLPGFK